jgi:hypothetical protein
MWKVTVQRLSSPRIMCHAHRSLPALRRTCYAPWMGEFGAPELLADLFDTAARAIRRARGNSVAEALDASREVCVTIYREKK